MIKNIIIIIFLITFIIVGIIFFNISKKDNNNHNYRILKENIIIKKEQIIKKLPIFIQKDLMRYNIDINTLDIISWKKFLEKIKNINITQKNRLNDISYNSLRTLILAKDLDLNLIKFLINNGFDINKKDENGITPLANLFLNSKEFNKNKIEELIKLGASLHINTNQELDILNLALFNKNIKSRDMFLKYLKEKGISFSTSDNPTKYLISMNKYLQNLKYMDEILPLIEDVNTPLPNGNNAFLHIISMDANNKSINYFLDNNVDITSDEPYKIMHLSIMNTKISDKNINRIINLGADVNARIETSLVTPLMIASMIGDIKKTKILLEHGANINLIDSKNRDIFNYANQIKDKKLKREMIQFLNDYKKGQK